MIKAIFKLLVDHSSPNIGPVASLSDIERLERLWGFAIPFQFRKFLLEIGNAEIFGDPIYSIFKVPDDMPCDGLHWINKQNPLLAQGLTEFYSNDLDGVYFLDQNGEVFLNTSSNRVAKDFAHFLDQTLSNK